MKNNLSPLTLYSNLNRKILTALMASGLSMSYSAQAEVVAKSENGFAILHIGDVKAKPEDIWRKILLPNSWWSRDYSWSGDSKNIYLTSNMNGCLCEQLKEKLPDGSFVQTGEVEHMRVIHVNENKVLRMTGALGPLQSEAVNGTLTIAIQPNEDGTSKLSFSYIVGGYMRYKVDAIAPNIDKVIGEQFVNLTKLLGPVIDTDNESLLKDDKAAPPTKPSAEVRKER